MNIFVANLNYRTDEEQLRSAFEEFGPVDSVKIIFDRATNRSKGFGFVEMTDDEDARQAIEDLHDEELDGRKLVVREARPNTERPRRTFDN